MPRKTRPVEDRFWDKVRKGEGCWEWTGALTQGYGVINLGTGKGVMRAHRLSYEINVGPVGGLWVLHKCDNPPCVRPDHLFLGDVQANNQDMLGKGRGWAQVRVACHNGHVYSEENTWIDGVGRKRCRVCRRPRRRVQRTEEESQQMRLNMGGPRRAKTHCPQGHPYDEVNTYVTPRGSRTCRACQRARREERDKTAGMPGRGDA